MREVDSRGYKKYFTLSFDDGVEQDKTLIALMRRYGLQGTFNLNAGLFGHHPRIADINRIPQDEIVQVYEGFEIASHGYRHENFRMISAGKQKASITSDIKALTAITASPIVGFAYPYDAYTKASETCLREQGILYARRARGEGSFRFPDNPLNYVPTCWFNAKNVYQLIDDFINTEPEYDDLLFMMWGHAYEMDYGWRKCPVDQLERILSKIAGQEDITYCSNREAFARAEGHC